MHAKTRITDWVELQKTQANTAGAGVKPHQTKHIPQLSVPDSQDRLSKVIRLNR